MYTLEQRWEILRHHFLRFLDEDHFDLLGYVNKQKCRIWGTEQKQNNEKNQKIKHFFWFAA